METSLPPTAETVYASYRWTLKELVAAQANHANPAQRRIVNTIVAIVGIIALAWWGREALRGNLFSRDLLPIYLILGLCSLYLWRVVSLMRGNPAEFARRRDAGKLCEYWFSPEEIRSRVEDISEGKKAWTDFLRVVHTPEGFLFYTEANAFFWVPDSAFSSVDQAGQVFQMAKQYARKVESR